MLQEGIGSQRMEVVYWTLYVELHFYALITLLAVAGHHLPAVRGVHGAVAAAERVRPGGGAGFAKVLLLWRYAPFFVAGMGFYLIYRYGHNLIVWLLIGCWLGARLYYDVKYNFPDFTVPGRSEYVIPAVVTAIFAVMALVATHRLSWLRWRGLTVLGMLTYPLYLVHQTVSRTFSSPPPHMGRWGCSAY